MRTQEIIIIEGARFVSPELVIDFPPCRIDGIPQVFPGSLIQFLLAVKSSEVNQTIL